MALAVGTRLGPYVIEAAIGAGGMGEVYRARDTRLDRAVAIKVLPAEVAAHADRLRRFEQEARAASALNHPNILTVFDVGSVQAPFVLSPSKDEPIAQDRPAGPIHYLVTELVEETRCVAGCSACRGRRSRRSWTSPSKSAARWRPRTTRASCIATSSPRT